MARFEYTKTVEHYSFKAPRMISEEDFNIIKMKIRMNPSEPLIDEKTVERSHDRLSGILLIGVAAVAISLIALFNSKEPPGWAIIILLIGVFGVLHPIVNMGNYESSKNQLNAERDRIQYFRKLKDIVSQSTDYRTFQINYRRYFWN
jgi:amino acid transporter